MPSHKDAPVRMLHFCLHDYFLNTESGFHADEKETTPENNIELPLYHRNQPQTQYLSVPFTAPTRPSAVWVRHTLRAFHTLRAELMLFPLSINVV
ncbi:hypothetical protein BDV29DRAFT_184769 [Aspergillus leporis]|jgi:hypothetical protein|uniref:Uncharacterized protein n=1 Tax=Aspergillus leporis TaxID=41062 RepID=A0A5N5WM76_9EURO|nr:hypothetical protein BDV29DRAFT_184769 [Aspergillus leporis]